jgi:hypothetical protein
MLRHERQVATARMNKCGCGNVARLGSDVCGRCERDGEPSPRTRQLLELRQRASEIYTLEAAADLIRDLLSVLVEELR